MEFRIPMMIEMIQPKQVLTRQGRLTVNINISSVGLSEVKTSYSEEDEEGPSTWGILAAGAG